MGYYIRFLSRSEKVVPLAQLQHDLKGNGLDSSLTLDAGTPEVWDAVLLSHLNGREIAAIERNAVMPGSLGEAEIEEFLDEIKGDKPSSAVDWLQQYLPNVKTIFVFQLFSGTEVQNGWAALHGVCNSLRPLGGITQADGEGFSNEEGHHILWQFSDHVKGPCWMAVLRNGEWVPFEMELSDRKQREAFCRGEVPQGVRLV